MSAMTSSYEDTVFNFDLDLLHHQSAHQTPKCTDDNEIDKQHKAQKAIYFIKQKAISNDTLIRQCYQVKDMLHQKEKALFVTKQGYQEACIQYKNALDKCSRLETDAKILQIQNQEIKDRYDHVQNQNGALQSHIKQLEAFVKEQEAIKETSKSEKLLEKVNVKSEINVSLQKQNKRLIQDLCTLGKILKKEKLTSKHKTLLKKYEKYFKSDNNNDDTEEHYKDGMDIFEDTSMSSSSIGDICNEKIPSFSIEIPVEIVADRNNTRKPCGEKYNQEDDIDRFSDCSNEITSADTGRGSSLAFSDNEKCFHSPEYFPIDNQICSATRNKTARNTVDVATSTDKVFERSDVATSPIDFGMNTIPTIRIDNAIPLTSNASTSPINFDVNHDSTSDNNSNNMNDLETSPVTIDNNEQQNTEVVHSRHLEKDCLEVNSSNYLEDECSRDDEIERIFNSMRFNNRFITPIPKTPSGSIEPEISLLVERVTVSCQTDTQPKCRCESIDVFHKDLISRITGFHQEIFKDKNQDQGLVTNSKPSDLNVTAESITGNLMLQPIDELPEITVINIETEEEEGISLNSRENNVNEIVVSLEHDTDDEPDNINHEATTSKTSSLDEETMLLSVDNAEKVQQNSSVRSRLLFEPLVDTNLHCEDNSNNNQSLELVDDHSDASSELLLGDIRPKRKLTKLDKFRKKMVPKFKIKKEINKPMKYPRTRLKQLLTKNKLTRKNRTPLPVHKQKVTLNDCSASLNDKSVYENAVRIMAELNKNSANINSNNNDLNKVKNENKSLKCKRTQNNNCEIQRNELDTTNNLITTRSRSKCEKTQIVDKITNELEATNENNKCISSPKDKKQLKRAMPHEQQEVQCKRILRSTTRLSITENNKTPNNDITESYISNVNKRDTKKMPEHNNSINFNDNINLAADSALVSLNQEINSASPKKITVGMNMGSERNDAISYNDMDLFTDVVSETRKKSEHETQKTSYHETHSAKDPKDSVLCHMIEKYHYVIKSPKKIPDAVTDTVCMTIEDNIKKIIDLPPEECKSGMNNLIELIQTWNINNFLAGFMKYLQDPQRKLELYSKVNSPPAPPMTKSEKIILYVVSHLKQVWPSIDIVNYILKHIEHILFKINRTPEFDTIESMAHFYALTCRYFDMRTRLRIFVLNAMYCIQFKAIALIKQTLDVWMHILPLGHMGTAKSPLVLCIVYLLHFYKCEDTFHRVQDIRNILNQKYSYKMSEWNEKRILEMFRNAIKEIKVPNNKKVVRLALLVLAKRQGPRWCQKNIITNMLLPMIEKEDARIKQFCITLLGPLMKPYPVDMKVHCEIIINQLLDMVNQNPSQQMEEAIYMSLMYISKHNQNRVIRALLDWHPKQISLECEEILCNFVKEKPAHIWDRVLSKIPLYSANNLI